MVKPKRHSPILMRSPIYKKTHSVKQTNKQTKTKKTLLQTPSLNLGLSGFRMPGCQGLKFRGPPGFEISWPSQAD